MLKEVKIEITNLCDRYCKHCSSNATFTHDNYIELDYELVCRIIDEASEMGAKSVVFTGGEATLWRDLPHAIAYAKYKGLQTKLYTMCYRTDENIMLLEQLVNCGLDEIIYSTASELIQRDEFSNQSLEEFIMGILKKVDVKFSFHHVVTKKTFDETKIKYICELLNSIKLKGKVSFLRLVEHGRATSELALTKEELQKFKELIIEQREKYGEDFIKIGSPFNILGITNTPCTAGDETMIIGFNGHGYPCDAMKYFERAGLGGSVYDNSLREIYESTYFRNIRDVRLHSGIKCLKCDNYSICKGGCLGQKMITYLSGEEVNGDNVIEYCAKQSDPNCCFVKKLNI